MTGAWRDRGSVGVVMLAVSVTIIVVMSVVMQIAAVLVVKRQVRVGADLAAVGAAHYVLRGEEATCELAEKLALANSVRLEKCSLDDFVVHVVVSRVWDPLVPFGGVASREAAMVRAEARAGPVSSFPRS